MQWRKNDNQGNKSWFFAVALFIYTGGYFMYDIKEVVIDFAAINEQKKELNEEQLNEFLFSTTAALGGSIKVLLGMMGMGDNFGVPVKIKGNRQEVNSFMRALKGERRYMDSVKKFGLDDP